MSEEEEAEPGAELARVSTSLANPATGEVVDLAAPDDALARCLEEVKALESELREYKAEVGRELLVRMDANASWTVKVAGGLRLESESPGLLEYDAEALHAELLALIEAEKITRKAANEALGLTVEKKVKKRGVKALEKLGGEVAEAIARTASKKPAGARRVSVKRDVA